LFQVIYCSSLEYSCLANLYPLRKTREAVSRNQQAPEGALGLEPSAIHLPPPVSCADRERSQRYIPLEKGGKSGTYRGVLLDVISNR
jgi:hypothetical protein